MTFGTRFFFLISLSFAWDSSRFRSRLLFFRFGPKVSRREGVSIAVIWSASPFSPFL